MPQPDQTPPGDGRGRPGKGDLKIPSPPSSKITPRLPRVGCICGGLPSEPCAYDVPAVDRYRARLGLPPLDRPDGWWSDRFADCRCQRGYWTGRGIFVCICRQEVA